MKNPGGPAISTERKSLHHAMLKLSGATVFIEQQQVHVEHHNGKTMTGWQLAIYIY